MTHRPHTHAHIHFTALWTLSGITWVIRYQKDKTNLDFTEARDSEWQQQICTSPQTDNNTNTPPLLKHHHPSLSFYRLDALPAAQPTASKFLINIIAKSYQ